MKPTAVFFDLDGTLLPMDQDAFVKRYFGLLAKKIAPLGYAPDQLVKAVWGGTAAMIANDGSCTNEEAFWRFFVGIYGEAAVQDKPVFDAFYLNEFNQAQAACGFAPEAAPLVRALKASGYRLVLATNPLFPAQATKNRIRWAGLEAGDFELYTTYENSRFCKPNPAYYQEILDKLGLAAQECLMVGNDADEDMIAEKLGMRVFLLTDCLINKSGRDLSAYPQGGFAQLSAYIEGLEQGAE
ncbi:MAG: HAD family hydrolase [Clostridia bacterium]|nr:HAD family hydrolase [Clostridia bacterium]